ncbi:L-ribulose-5-phosphate 4-epimerase AraD [Candidatus Poribacteria bacterium]|nr:L-ribulose-5-phosphate 4-epimerase AraD [Candidatus Poribacteria bacterium]
MDFQNLKNDVWKANIELAKSGLIILTWGNVSGVDREAEAMAIKPSGVDYKKLKPEDIVVISIKTGEVIDGDLRPSSDTPTHLFLYQEFKNIGGIAHTHSTHATSWAQASMEIPCLGTTHADTFYGPIPITRNLTTSEIKNEYEKNTGKVIVEYFHEHNLVPLHMPAILVANHGPFIWGENPMDSFVNAIVLEEVAKMALYTLQLSPKDLDIPRGLLDKHFLRKHGPKAYYGQKK